MWKERRKRKLQIESEELRIAHRNASIADAVPNLQSSICILQSAIMRSHCRHDHLAARQRPSTSASSARTGPGQTRYWERYRVAVRAGHELHQRAAEDRREGRRRSRAERVAPVVWECNCLEEVCGACTMLINGRVRQACTALVDRLLAERPGEIELRPMTKFPVLRDLVVDRSRIFATLEEDQGLGAGRQLPRHGPRPAAVAGDAAVGLPATASA